MSAVVMSAALIADATLAGEAPGNDAARASAQATAGTVTCPAVPPNLPPVPARAEANRDLALLDTQIAEAAGRLRETVGHGGADCVRSAVLGPLQDKRVAGVDRIATAIGRLAARPQGLAALAPCTVGAEGAGGGPAGATASASQTSGGSTGGAGPGMGAGAGAISCPDVPSRLPAVPVSARAEADRDLALLDTQVVEAEERLRESVGEGGPDFVRNALLGPLQDKRAAAIERIVLAIGRTAAEPQGLGSLAACTLTR
ncbi:hypothetical protein [Streptomyces chromofuscus]|uniref:hypothetical protein n=1 Tax=Streptomyces chromofuscus TaxID=42881 RepID=UPI0027E468F0|nr:hypothetical protein [Streptomyces chromofuscus]